MLPFLHKYITASPSHSHSKHKKRSRSHSHHKQKKYKPKPSITSSSDTFHSQFSNNNSNNSNNSNSNEHKYNELPTTSESKVILIETNSETDSDYSKSSKSSKSSKRIKKSSKKHIKYWTVSIASKHNNISKLAASQITMGFGVCDATNSNSINDLNTEQLLKSSNYGYGYCVTYCDNQKYQSYHTKLKSLDDILIAFHTKSNKLTLWQNGKRFNRIFQLYPSKMYGFGIKLYGDDYSIKILPNTGN